MRTATPWGGLRLPAVEAPLGTFGGWNAPLDNNCGDMSTFWWPFARTRWQRLMTRDARPSVEERYRSAAEYMERFRAAATRLASEGYLLEADARGMVEISAMRIQVLFPLPGTAPR